MRKRAFFQFSAFVGVALLAGQAQAQSTGPAPAASVQAQQPSSTLSEVIVTAQRRSQRLEEVPISVTAVSGKDLAKAGVTGLKDLQTVAPSFQMSAVGVFTQLAIRGITSTTLGPGIEGNVAVYVDGFYEPTSTALGSDFTNVSDVQVLKGPQGTLYGRNATGGALLVNTYEPSLTRPIIEIGGNYGNFNDRRIHAYVGMPITSTLAFGVGVNYHANDGYIKNVNGTNAAPLSETEVRVKLKWEPTSNFDLVLGENYFYKSDPLMNANSAQLYSPWATFGLVSPGPQFTTQLDKISQNPNPIFTDQELETTLKAKWTTDYGTFTNHMSYTDERPHFDDDYDGTYLNIQEIPSVFERHTFMEQLDYEVKPIETVDIQAGAFYFNDESSDNVTVDLGPQAVAFLPTFTTFEHANLALHTRAYAGYINGTWEVVPHVFLNAGVRYSNDERSVNSYFLSYALAGLDPTYPNYPTQAPKTTAHFPATTPSATIRWEFAPRTDVYLSYSQGFKSGAFNTVGQSPITITTPIQPERINAYEIGFKTAHGPFHFESAAYYYDYKDLQVQAIGSDPTTGQVLVTYKNAATAKIWGLEASGAWAVTPEFNLRAGVAYTHARYGSFPDASVNLPFSNPGLGGLTTIINTYPCQLPGGAGCVAGVTPSTIPGLGTQPVGTPVTENFSGRRIARAPDITANVGGDYTIPISVGKVVFSGNVYYSSAYAPVSEAYDPVSGKAIYYDGDYVIANLAVDWVRDHYTVGAYVNDVGDTRYAIRNESAPAFGYGKIYSSPRTYGVRINYVY